MKKYAAALCALIAIAAQDAAIAQQKTRAQVYEELIEARQNGLDFVTDASYPEVSPFYADQVARMRASQGDARRRDAVAGGGAMTPSATGGEAPAATD